MYFVTLDFSMEKEMNYQEARACLEEISSLGSVLGLDTMKELLKRLENPQQDLKVVHIAGTNGKGSIMTFLQSILIEAGYRIGRYSSPAVFEFREMFQIGIDYISEEDFARLFFKVQTVAQKMVEDGLAHPTEFEMETAIAFLLFQEKNCDIVLIECGMGGETDATNVFSKNLCSIIATISLDHMKFLGNTLQEIAKVKSGIIKNGCPVVSSIQSGAVETVLRLEANNKNAEYIQAKTAIMTEEGKFKYLSNSGETYSFAMQMKGSYQLKNVATAIEAAEQLEKKGFSVGKFIESGIEKAIWPGRMEVISKEPLIIIDGAHNPGAVEELVQTIQRDFTNRTIAFIMGVLADKDYEEEAKMIAGFGKVIYTVTPDNKRALPAERLAETLRKYQGAVQAKESVAVALEQAILDVEEGKVDMILAFGSLSYLKEVKNYVLRRK